MNAATAAPAPGRLEELEGVIARGLSTFVEVGSSLLEIRDARLYRTTHSTFESYCKDRWGFTARRGRQLMAAASLAAEIESGTQVPVPTERHARELAAVVRDRGVEAASEMWRSLAAEAPPTVADVRDAAAHPVPVGHVTQRVRRVIADTEGIADSWRSWSALREGGSLGNACRDDLIAMSAALGRAAYAAEKLRRALDERIEQIGQGGGA